MKILWRRWIWGLRLISEKASRKVDDDLDWKGGLTQRANGYLAELTTREIISSIFNTMIIASVRRTHRTPIKHFH